MTEKRFTTFVENGSVCLNDALKVYKVVDVHYYEYLLDCMNELNNENEQLKEELESFEQVSFTDLCDGSRTVLYMKKENVGDVE